MTPENTLENTSGSLYQLVDSNIKSYLAAAMRNSNSLVNNVSDKLRINTNQMVVNSVIGGLLNAVITHVKESHIYISAKELYGKMIEINIKDDNCYNTYAVALSLQDVVPLAEKIGGRLDITNQRQKITTISFRFPVEQESVNMTEGK
ncbi:MAG: hypothetical protein H7Y42_12155 [Chitinophagaceae bacterium]|nr:hypothetical protein [Chitinophagaceae bacterium]